jgi:hypothetical protein
VLLCFGMMAQRSNVRKEFLPNQTLFVKNLPEKLKKEGL